MLRFIQSTNAVSRLCRRADVMRSRHLLISGENAITKLHQLSSSYSTTSKDDASAKGNTTGHGHEASIAGDHGTHHDHDHEHSHNHSHDHDHHHDHDHDHDDTEVDLESEQVEMWNPKAPGGPEWNGPRGYEPTEHGDWARKGRVSDF